MDYCRAVRATRRCAFLLAVTVLERVPSRYQLCFFKAWWFWDTLSIKIAQKLLHKIGPLGQNALGFEFFEGKG